MQRVLVKVDRMSMANSLEVRVPFLDKASIDFAWKHLPDLKNNKFKLKDILKKMMNLYYPSKIIEEEKKGFSVPIDSWLKTHLKSDVENAIFEKPFYGEMYINKETLLEYVTQFFDGKHDEAWGVWHIYAWQKWAMAQKLI
jgi:asparagine synthase (glutamine-hydrolysing)